VKTPGLSVGRRKMALVGLAMVLPAVGLCLLFDWFPMVEGIYRAFYRWDGYLISEWVGVQNFVDIFHDEIFWVSVKNMLFFLAWGVFLMLPTIVACVILFRLRNARMQYLYRVLFCIPMIVPGVVTILMWQFMYNPQYGFFNQLLESAGLGVLKRAWLGTEATARWAILFSGFPWVSTNAALIYIGGLKAVDTSIWEAVKLDGVGPVRRLVRFELPLIAGQFKLTLIGTIAGAITGYSTQLIMTNGGPGFATTVPGLYMYKAAFRSHQYGYASALGLVLFAIALALTLATLKFVRSDTNG
jgi:raffinose/stachyose/melibiose transport system permease protein